MSFKELISKILKKRLDDIMTDLLADESLDTVVIQLHYLLCYLLRVEFLDLSDNRTSCNLLDKEGGTLCSIVYNQRICSSLISEGCICLETMSL